MTTTTIEYPKIGDYIHVRLKHGGLVQIKIEEEGIIIDTWDTNDMLVSTQAREYLDFVGGPT